MIVQMHVEEKAVRSRNIEFIIRFANMYFTWKLHGNWLQNKMLNMPQVLNPVCGERISLGKLASSLLKNKLI